jgi:hypothetical protein
VKGAGASIDALCDRVLNVPAGGAVHYSPIGEHVLILTGSFAHVASEAPGFSSRGSVRETQMSLWVPTIATDPQTEQSVSLCMFVPYIFVDNPMSLLGGREDFGYAKAMGQFEPPAALGATVTLSAFGGDFAPENQAAWHPLIELQGPSSGASDTPGESGGAWQSGPELVELISGAAAGGDPRAGELEPIGGLVQALFDGRVQQVFLKQFRDAGSADDTCYQAVVEAPAQISNVRWCPSVTEWTVTIHPLDSQPIAKELGISDQTTRLTYQLDFDMTVGTGTVIGPAPPHTS